MSADPSVTTPSLNPDNVLSALANSHRWEFLQLLADGHPRSASTVAGQFGRDFDGVSKHLRLLRSAGVIASRRGDDRRQELFFVPGEFRTREGELDFGFCLFRVPGARPPVEAPAVASVPTPTPTPTPASHPAQPFPWPQPKPPVFLSVPDSEADAEDDEEAEDPPYGFGEMLTQRQPFGFKR